LLALILSWVFLEPNASLRPHLLTWPLAIAVFVYLLPQPPPWRPRRYLRLALLMILWVNLHSSALIVPILVGVFLLTRLGYHLRGPSTESRRSLRHAALVFFIAAGSCLVQPTGPPLLKYVWETPTFNVRSQEWQTVLTTSTFADRPFFVLSFVVLALSVLGLGLRRRPRQGARPVDDGGFPDFWVALACLVLGGLHRRMAVFLFVPIFYVLRQLGEEWRRVLETKDDARIIDPRLLSTLRTVLAVTILLLALLQAPDALTPHGLRPELFPEAASRFLAEVQLEGRMFNGPNWGGYLSYRLYPEVQTFMDGRWVLAGRQVLEDQDRLYRHDQPEPLLDRYAIDYLVQPLRDYLLVTPLDSEDWALAFVDRVSVVLLRQTPRFGVNSHRVCEFYASRPQLENLARWPQVEGIEPAAGVLSIPTVLDFCTSPSGSGT
jgi:hypothetical protein